jgi:hypothetical protein
MTLRFRVDLERMTMDSSSSRLIELFRDAFYAEIAIKTSWGNVELKLAFERALSNAISKLLVELG